MIHSFYHHQLDVNHHAHLTIIEKLHRLKKDVDLIYISIYLSIYRCIYQEIEVQWFKEGQVIDVKQEKKFSVHKKKSETREGETIVQLEIKVKGVPVQLGQIIMPAYYYYVLSWPTCSDSISYRWDPKSKICIVYKY